MVQVATLRYYRAHYTAAKNAPMLLDSGDVVIASRWGGDLCCRWRRSSRGRYCVVRLVADDTLCVVADEKYVYHRCLLDVMYS